MSDRLRNWIEYTYLVIVLLCLLLVNPVRAGLCYHFNWSYSTCEGFPYLVALVLSIIGTLIVRYVMFDKNEINWWLTFLVFCGTYYMYYLLFAGVSFFFKEWP